MQFHLYLICTELKTQILFPVGNTESVVAEPLICSLLSQTNQFINSLLCFPYSNTPPPTKRNPNAGETHSRFLNFIEAKSNWSSLQETLTFFDQWASLPILAVVLAYVLARLAVGSWASKDDPNCLFPEGGEFTLGFAQLPGQSNRILFKIAVFFQPWPLKSSRILETC